MRVEQSEGGLKSIASQTCREQEGKCWRADSIYYLKSLSEGMCVGIRGCSSVCVSERDYLHVEDFIRALRLPGDVTDFIGGLRR